MLGSAIMRGFILLVCLGGGYEKFSRGSFQSSEKQDGGSTPAAEQDGPGITESVEELCVD